MRRRVFIQGAAGIAAAAPALAAPSRLVVAELFTSQGCSSCPPADMLLTELAQTQPNLLPLAFHVTYWNNLGWRDPFSLDSATARQRAYGRLLALDSIYTPQLVVAGRQDVVGSDRAGVLEALASARPAPTGMTVAREGLQAVVGVADGSGNGTVLLVGYDRQHRTAIGRGENSGRNLLETNIVRSATPLGAWQGRAQRFTVPLPEGERLAVLLQAVNGAMLGAAREET